MAYTTINKSTDYFNTKLWSGNSSTQAITGVGFQPDFVWGKQRTGTQSHQLLDAIRGANNILTSNSDAAAVADSNILNSFDSDGFTLGNQDQLNDTGATYVSWNWKANGQGSSNTDGSINTTYTSANTTSGVSIIQYTGNSTSGATIAHGLGAVPKVFFCKKTNSSGDNWAMYHVGTGNTISMTLNSATSTIANAKYWNNTTPTSSLITLGNGTEVNGNTDTFIGYAFAEKIGFSKFSSFVGNGSSDGPFLFCGFKPSFLLLKNTVDAAKNWEMIDNRRPSSGQNPADDILFPDTADAEASSQTDRLVDFVSTGVKIRGNSAQMNASGQKFIYLAFAEAPLVGSNNVPCNAR